MNYKFQWICRISNVKIWTILTLWPRSFQSTHRVSDATNSCGVVQWWRAISIHAPRERCDSSSSPRSPKSIAFQSTHRVSDATEVDVMAFNDRLFQSTHRVSDATCARGVKGGKIIFQSTHRVSDATHCFKQFRNVVRFQSTHRVSDATLLLRAGQLRFFDFNPRTA